MEHQEHNTKRNEEQVNWSENVYYQQNFSTSHNYDHEKIKPQSKFRHLFARLIILLVSFIIWMYLVRISMYKHSGFEGELGNFLFLGWFIAFNIFENMMLSFHPLRTTIYRLQIRLQIAFLSAFLLTTLAYFLYSNGIHGLTMMWINLMGAIMLLSGNLIFNIFLSYFKSRKAEAPLGTYNPYPTQRSNFRPQE
jgi:hypothetical protein